MGETPNYAFSVNFFIRSVFRVKGNVGGLEDGEFYSESIAAIFDASCPLVWEIPAFECFDRIHYYQSGDLGKTPNSTNSSDVRYDRDKYKRVFQV